MPKNNADKPRPEHCRECPFKRDSMPGYLGECSGDPEKFLASFWGGMIHDGELSLDGPLPCHLEVDWSGDKFDRTVRSAHTCRGAAQLMRNFCKDSRHPDMSAAINALDGPEKEVCFGTPMEFIEHHKRGK